MSDWEQDKQEARARLANVERAADVRALYDALCVVADTLSAFQAQPRFIVEGTGDYNVAGDYLDGLQHRAEADIAALVEIASAGVERQLERTDRDNLNRVLLHYETRTGQPPDEIAALAATLAVKADRLRVAQIIAERHEVGA